MKISKFRLDAKWRVTSMLRTRSQVRVLVGASASVAQLAERVRHLLRPSSRAENLRADAKTTGYFLAKENLRSSVFSARIPLSGRTA